METRTRSIALSNIILRANEEAGEEVLKVSNGTLWIHQQYVEVGVPGMRRWEVEVHQPPLKLAMLRAEYLRFEANGYSGKCIMGQGRLRGTGPLAGLE